MFKNKWKDAYEHMFNHAEMSRDVFKGVMEWYEHLKTIKDLSPFEEQAYEEAKIKFDEYVNMVDHFRKIAKSHGVEL